MDSKHLVTNEGEQMDRTLFEDQELYVIISLIERRYSSLIVNYSVLIQFADDRNDLGGVLQYVLIV